MQLDNYYLNSGEEHHQHYHKSFQCLVVTNLVYQLKGAMVCRSKSKSVYVGNHQK